MVGVPHYEISVSKGLALASQVLLLVAVLARVHNPKRVMYSCQ